MLFLKFDNNGFGDCDCSEDEVVPYVYNPQTNDCYATYAQVNTCLMHNLIANLLPT